MRSAAVVDGNSVLYNGYECQVFASGEDGPVDPNGDGYSHAKLPFTLPPGFEVASFEDPGLENMATELIGAFGWATWHVTVANTNGYEMWNTKNHGGGGGDFKQVKCYNEGPTRGGGGAPRLDRERSMLRA